MTTLEELCKRITDYLSTGGLFNPELMDHNKVSDLLKDCRLALEAAAAPERVHAAVLVEAIHGLLGLLRLVRGRPDISPDVRDALTDSHRITDAQEAVAGLHPRATYEAAVAQPSREAALVKALEPFAKMANGYDTFDPRLTFDCGSKKHFITVRDLRAARKALAAYTPAKDERRDKTTPERNEMERG